MFLQQEVVEFDNQKDFAAAESARSTKGQSPQEDEDSPTATRETFQSMGLRCEKTVAEHLLLENAYESNLLSDISKVDYLDRNLGCTNLHPLEGFPAFVDDVFVFGYLSQEEGVFHRGKLSSTTGEKGAAKLVVRSIANALERALGKEKRKPVAIVHTVTVGALQSSAIRATIDRIERDTLCLARKRWERIHPQKKIVGYFVAKCDVSEVPVEDLHRGLEVFEKCLEGFGYGFYSIDYTQDFSGVLNREALVAHLGFPEKGDFCRAIREKMPTILDNTNVVGKHVCTWIESREDGRAARTKIYNKVVVNFEAGEIRESFGGHLADYADCPNQHLQRTFQHPDVQERGCTRIEVSLYAPPLCELSRKKVEGCIGEVLRQVSNEDEREGVFVVQPPRKQWGNLAKTLDRSLVLADRPQGKIFVGWYVHTETKRISGVRVHVTETKVRDAANWEKAVLWAAGDFGFRKCPIFQVDILSADEEEVELGLLRYYAKDENSRTILTDSKNPTQLHPNARDPTELLPPTDKVVWEWRTKKCHAIGTDLLKHKLQEIPEIAEQRKISALSTRNRVIRLAEILMARKGEEWRQRIWRIEEKERERLEEEKKAREAEIANLRIYAETKEKIEQKSFAAKTTVLDTLAKIETKKISQLLEGREWRVLGFRRKEDKVRVVLHGNLDIGGLGPREPVAVWATGGLRKILQECSGGFCSYKDSFERELFWLVSFVGVEKFGELVLRIQPSKAFKNREGKTIEWNPIEVVSAPERGKLEFLKALGARCEEYEALRAELAKNYLHKIGAPKDKDTKRTTDLPEGEYICKRFAETEFRKARRTILFLLPLREDGKPTDEEIPVHGVFLEQEIAKIGGIPALEKRGVPLRCKLSEEKTTPSKRKCRRVWLA